MPVDSQLEPILEASAAMMALDMDAVTPEMMREVAAASVLPFPLPDIAATADQMIPGPAGLIAARLYRPSSNARLPAILFLHGGGWVMGTISQYERFARELALASGCAVLSVDYRLAPEHPYPAAIEDCYAALLWLADKAESLGIDGKRFAVAGDSAGGNLAAVLALLARDRQGPTLRHQLLFYPATDRACTSASYAENDRYLVTPASLRWYWKQYLSGRDAKDTPLAAPAEFDNLVGLPPATVISAEYDPLRDEGEAYALALARAGVPTEVVRAQGMIHGFMAMSGLVDAAGTWMAHAGKRLADAMHKQD